MHSEGRQGMAGHAESNVLASFPLSLVVVKDFQGRYSRKTRDGIPGRRMANTIRIGNVPRFTLTGGCASHCDSHLRHRCPVC